MKRIRKVGGRELLLPHNTPPEPFRVWGWDHRDTSQLARVVWLPSGEVRTEREEADMAGITSYPYLRVSRATGEDYGRVLLAVTFWEAAVYGLHPWLMGPSLQRTGQAFDDLSAAAQAAVQRAVKTEMYRRAYSG